MNQNQQTIEPKTIKSRAISYGNEALVSPENEVVNGLTRALTLNTAADGKLLRKRIIKKATIGEISRPVFKLKGNIFLNG